LSIYISVCGATQQFGYFASGTGIGVDFGVGQPGHVPSPNAFITFPPIFWFAHPIFLTSLRQWVQDVTLLCLYCVHGSIMRGFWV